MLHDRNASCVDRALLQPERARRDGHAPHERWRVDLDRIRQVDEEVLRRAFLWRETRTADKAGVLSLFGRKYQVGPNLARKRVSLRYDPEQLDLVEVWHDNRFVERVRPFEVQPHRRPKPKAPEPLTQDAPATAAEPVANWLSHLTKAHQRTRQQDPEAALRRALARSPGGRGPRDPAGRSATDRRRRSESTRAVGDRPPETVGVYPAVGERPPETVGVYRGGR